MTKKKICTTINEIADKYHFVSVDGELNGKYFPNNLVLMSLSYLLDSNHIMIGDPGWGKTTVAQILSSKLSGIPFDLYESLTIEGHPGLYTEKWKARPHYGQLAQGKEKVVWQGCFGLDTLIVDEISRISYDVQDEMLEGIRTGRWKYMNDVLFEGKKPIFLTTNFKDNGNGDIIQPLEDRIHIVTEESAGSPFANYQAAEEAARKNLSNPEATSRALEALVRMDFGALKDIVHKTRMGDYLTHEEKLAIQEEIKKIPFTNDANYFLWTLVSEINFSQKYGKKRARDPISDDTHDKKYAGVYVKNSLSPRPQMAARLYSQGLAWILGDNEVKVDHMRYILPYVTAHKLNFHDDFKGSPLVTGSRDDYEDLHLAKMLVKDVNGRYEDKNNTLKNMIAKLQKGKIVRVSGTKKFKVDGGPEETIDAYDHPLLRQIIQSKVLTPKSDL